MSETVTQIDAKNISARHFDQSNTTEKAGSLRL